MNQDRKSALDRFWEGDAQWKADNVRTSGEVHYNQGRVGGHRALYAQLVPSSLRGERPPAPARPAQPASPPSDAAWVCEHPNELAPYAGRWVAIVNRQVLGSGKGAIEARTEALGKDPESSPLLWFVEG
jgi:hypothetical protein